MSKVSQRGNIAIVLLFVAAIIAVAAGAYLYGKGSLKLPTKQPASPGAQVSATPTLNETASWKKYNYPEFGYSLKAPASYKSTVTLANNSSDPNMSQAIQSVYFRETDASQGKNDLGVGVWSGNLTSSFQKLSVDGFAKTGTKNISGHEWTIVKNSLETQYMYSVSSKTYIVGGGNTSLVEQFLSTFKFTN